MLVKTMNFLMCRSRPTVTCARSGRCDSKMGFIQRRRRGDVERKAPKFPRDGDMYHRYLSRCGVVARASSLEGPSELQIWTWKGTPEEEEALGKLKEAVNQTDYKDRVDEEQLRWFLLDRKLDWMEAQSKLISMLKWRERIGSDDLQTTDIAKEAATGKAYIHTHLDVLDRPVLVVRASKHVLGASPLESSEQLCSFLLDRAIEKLPPGQKTILGIFDLRGFSTRNADIQFATFLIDAFFTYYPKRVSQVLIVEAPWVFTPVYNVVKPLLRKYAALVRFVSVEEVRREYFTPLTLPEDFQGKGFPKD